MKKSFALFFAMALLIFTLAACGTMNGNTDKKKPDAAQDQTTETTSNDQNATNGTSTAAGQNGSTTAPNGTTNTSPTGNAAGYVYGSGFAERDTDNKSSRTVPGTVTVIDGKNGDTLQNGAAKRNSADVNGPWMSGAQTSVNGAKRSKDGSSNTNATANTQLRGSGTSGAVASGTVRGRGDEQYRKMLSNAHVHDRDGFLLDGENTHYVTW